MAGMVQMNTRIERSLKERGDAALAHAGYSPSSAVRKLWEKAAGYAQDARAIRELLEPSADALGSTGVDDAHASRKGASWKLQASCIVPDAFQNLGLKPSRMLAGTSYNELRDFAYAERLDEGVSRG